MSMEYDPLNITFSQFSAFTVQAIAVVDIHSLCPLITSSHHAYSLTSSHYTHSLTSSHHAHW